MQAILSWTTRDSLCFQQQAYDPVFEEEVYSVGMVFLCNHCSSCRIIHRIFQVQVSDLLAISESEDSFRIEYSSNAEFVSIAKKLRIMEDIKVCPLPQSILFSESEIVADGRVVCFARHTTAS